MAVRSSKPSRRIRERGQVPFNTYRLQPSAYSWRDQALYFAKERGRNRVEVASLDLVLDRHALDVVPTVTRSAAQNAA